MNILITEKEFQEYRKLQQEKNELLKYKNAWEELKLIINAVAFDKVRTTMRELEQKNGIEVSRDVKEKIHSTSI